MDMVGIEVTPLRATVTLLVLGLFAGLEAWRPRRARIRARRGRWVSNVGVMATSALMATALMPLPPMAAAILAADGSVGLLNQPLATALPWWAAGLLSIALLDLAVYAQHVAMHRVPLLWRLHRMHHADVDLDVTSGFRFHPAEIVLSLAYKTGIVLLLGAPAWAVVVFEIVLNATAQFNHANLAVPVPIDRWLRLVVVTPDMHRVHHSVRQTETNSNFGFNVPWWDRLFGTYTAQPSAGHAGMTIGLERFRSETENRLDRLLLQPFRGRP